MDFYTDSIIDQLSIYQSMLTQTASRCGRLGSTGDEPERPFSLIVDDLSLFVFAISCRHEDLQ